MAKLVLSAAGTVVFQCFLDDQRMYIGRQPHNQVVVDDPAVSSEHAAIVPVGNDHILEDLQSANGTFVNGTRIARHILQHGDVIEFGHYNLRYLNPRAAAEKDLDRTMMITGLGEGAMRPMTDIEPRLEHVPLPPAAAARGNVPKGRVKIIAGPRVDTKVELDRVVVTFGIPGDQLAVITRRPHGFFVTHVEGRRFPLVNGQSIDREARQLRRGDTIEVGTEKLEFVQD